jgi:hypothetical protein
VLPVCRYFYIASRAFLHAFLNRQFYSIFTPPLALQEAGINFVSTQARLHVVKK